MRLILLIICHLLGDYVLQSDFIAKTKGSNWYHLFVHSLLYCVPFIIFNISVTPFILTFIFITHMIIDALKARYDKITYLQDQLLHYVVLIIIAIL